MKGPKSKPKPEDKAAPSEPIPEALTGGSGETPVDPSWEQGQQGQGQTLGEMTETPLPPGFTTIPEMEALADRPLTVPADIDPPDERTGEASGMPPEPSWLPSELATDPVTGPRPPVDYQALARACYKASQGHGNARDRELLAECSAALCELGGFEL